MNDNSFRGRASFGKRQEYVAFGELLKRGFDVYATLVDDQGIDCIIRISSTCYLDIQIKARATTAQQGYTFAAMTVPARSNLFFIFYVEHNDTYWVIPSIALQSLCNVNKAGKNAGKMTLQLRKSGGEFDQYRGEDGFELLRKACSS